METHYLDIDQVDFVSVLSKFIREKIPFLIGTGPLKKDSFLPLRLKDHLGSTNGGKEFISNTYWISTSGTTGKPKYFGISFDSLYKTVQALDNEMLINEQDVELIFAPIRYSFGLARFASAVIGNREYHIAKTITDLSCLNRNKHRPISLGLNPYMLKLWFDTYESYFTENSFHSIKLESGSMPLYNAIVQQTVKNLNPKLWIHHYGMTEASRSSFKQVLAEGIENYNEESLGSFRKGVELKRVNDKYYLSGTNVAKYRLEDNEVKKISSIEINDALEHNNEGGFSILGRSDDLVKFKGSLINLAEISRELMNEFGAYMKPEIDKYSLIVKIDNAFSGSTDLPFRVESFLQDTMGIRVEAKFFYLNFTETGKIK